MIQEINSSSFVDAFRDMGRENQFSYEGKIALFDFLEGCESEENPMELDVIGICCDFCEYGDIEEYLKEHDSDIDKSEYMENEGDKIGFEMYEEELEKEISYKTTLIKLGNSLDDGFIIQNY